MEVEHIANNFAIAGGQWLKDDGISSGACPATTDAIIMETAIVTGWGSLIPHPEATRADVICIQEHKVLESDIPKCRSPLQEGLAIHLGSCLPNRRGGKVGRSRNCSQEVPWVMGA